MNIDNMKRLKTHLELERQKFNYNHYIAVEGDEWIADTADAYKQLYHNQCGTTGCMAGMATAIAIVEDNVEYEVDCDGEVDAHEIAADWLGLSPNKAYKLFLGTEMADRPEFGYEFGSEALAHARPEEAAKLLQMIIDEAEEAGD